jgi:hypothetical protein
MTILKLIAIITLMVAPAYVSASEYKEITINAALPDGEITFQINIPREMPDFTKGSLSTARLNHKSCAWRFILPTGLYSVIVYCEKPTEPMALVVFAKSGVKRWIYNAGFPREATAEEYYRTVGGFYDRPDDRSRA